MSISFRSVHEGEEHGITIKFDQLPGILGVQKCSSEHILNPRKIALFHGVLDNIYEKCVGLV